MKLVNNISGLTVEESIEIDHIYSVHFEGKQISAFCSKKEAMVILDIFASEIARDIIRMVKEIHYTPKMDMLSPISHLSVVRIGNQDYVFAYNQNGQACDIFQYDNRDFFINERDLNDMCTTAYDGILFCMTQYEKWMRSSNRRNSYQSV